MQIDFHGYCLVEVWQKTTKEERVEVIRFWLTEEAITDEEEARQRVHQLVTLVRDPSGAIAGVSTAYIDGLGKDNTPHYFYRMFISPKNRRPILMIRMIDFSREILKQRTPVGSGIAAGMVIVTENPKAMNPGSRRMLDRHGYRLLGQNNAGQDVWRVGFFDN